MTIEPNKAPNLISGLSYSYPTSGTIRLGYARTRERAGKTIKLPMKDDEFTITTKVKSADGTWERHELDATLRGTYGEPTEGDGSARKLRRIPVTVVFDNPDLNMSEQYAAFTQEGRPLCVGNGCTARRRQSDGTVTEETCPGPAQCEFGAEARCDAFLRLLVRIEGQDETAPPFILRTGSVNAVTDNRSTLEHWSAMFGGRLAGLPFTFVLDAKQTALSRQSVFYYGRLEPRFKTLIEGATLLANSRQRDQELGINRAAAEASLMRLRGNGAFSEEGRGDGEQFDDLLAGRFDDEVDGEPRTTRIGKVVGSEHLESPRSAAAKAVCELSNLLSQSQRPAVVASAVVQAAGSAAEAS